MGESQSKNKVDLKKAKTYDPYEQFNTENDTPFQERDLSEQVEFVNEILKQKFQDTSNKGKNILQFLKERGYSLTDEILGQGGFGMVVKGYNHKRKQYVAIKIVKFKNTKQFFDNLLEFNTQQDLRHKNIIHTQEIINLNELKIQFIVMELCKSDLISYLNYFLNQKKWISREEILQIWLQLIQGLKYLHSKSVLHLDIKPGNILLGTDNQWKFNDFGLSHVLDDGQSSTTDTKGFTQSYSSPEQYYHHSFKIQQNIAKESDIYSLGLVFLVTTQVILIKNTLIKLKLEESILKQYLNAKYESLNKDIICKMLTGSPKERISLQDIEYYLQDLKNGGNQITRQVLDKSNSVPLLDIQNRRKKSFEQSPQMLFNSIEKISVVQAQNKKTLPTKETDDETFQITPIKQRPKRLSHQMIFQRQSWQNQTKQTDASPENDIDLVQLGTEKKQESTKVTMFPILAENQKLYNKQRMGIGYFDQPTKTQQNEYTTSNTDFIKMIQQNQRENQLTPVYQNPIKEKYNYFQSSNNNLLKSSKVREEMNFLPNIYQNQKNGVQKLDFVAKTNKNN